MSSTLRYYAAACQTDLPNPTDRAGIAEHVTHMLAMIDRAVLGYAPFAPVRLVVFPEFGHAAPLYPTVEELHDRLAVPIPNELKNVAGDPQYAAVLKELRGRLRQWQEQTKDPWLVKYQHE